MAKNDKQGSKNAKAAARGIAAWQQRRQRMVWTVGSTVVVVAAVLVLVVVAGSKKDAKSGVTGDLKAKAAPASIAEDLAAVPLEAIAGAWKEGDAGNSNPVRPNPDGKAREVDGKPEVLYMGGEFCPYCAGERWALTVALSKFGEFSNLDIVHSAESNVPTLSFRNASYTSDYVTFTPIEMSGNQRVGNGWNQLDKATEEQAELLQTLGQGAFPFIDFGGTSYQQGGSVDVQSLLGSSQVDIAEKLAAAKPDDADLKSLPGSVNVIAGEFISTICGLTGGEPGDVCKAFPTA